MDASSQSSSAKLNALADTFVRQELAQDPTLAYSMGLKAQENSRFPDRRPSSLETFDREEAVDLASLRAIDTKGLPPSERAVYANLKEQLESDLQLRVCKTELWNVNHFFGWQDTFTQVAEQQPINTSDERAQALQRWSTLPEFLEIEIVNLTRGLSEGYSAPQAVVRKVIAQTGALSSAPPENSSFYSPAARSNDLEFKAAYTSLLVEQINPAVKRYHDFLQSFYLPRARMGVAVSDLPNGAACYRAFLRKNTTLDRSPRAVYELGLKTVAANRADIARIGKEMFGVTDVPTILAKTKAQSTSHFSSAEEELAYSREVLARAKVKTAAFLVNRMPRQDVVILPERDFEEAAGVTSHFEAIPDDSQPAVFRIQLGGWRNEVRGQAELTVAHETLPGHHLQIAAARELEPGTLLSKLIFNSAYVEGWARYAEGLAEEVGIYSSPDSRIWRRVTPARGMVLDTGLHAMHWTRKRAVEYLVSSGLFDAKGAEDIVDRAAVLPGQLSSYDSGGLEIQALRRKAQDRLGKSFDLREFDHVVLEEGVVPLSELKSHVETWVATKAATHL